MKGYSSFPKAPALLHLVVSYNISTNVGYLMQNPFYTCKQFDFKQFSLVKKVEWFQVLLCITNNSNKHQSFIYAQLNVKTVLYKALQLKTVLFQAIQFSICIDRTLASATTPDQSRQEICITRTSLSECLVSYIRTLVGGVLPLYRDTVRIFYNPT